MFTSRLSLVSDVAGALLGLSEVLSASLGLRRGDPESEDMEGLLLREPRTCTTICLKPGTIAVGPKYRKYGTCVRLLELTEARLLSGLSTAARDSNSLFREDISNKADTS